MKKKSITVNGTTTTFDKKGRVSASSTTRPILKQSDKTPSFTKPKKTGTTKKSASKK